MTVRAEKIAAALFAILFAYLLKCTILDYATEPKVIGGVDFDRPIPQFIPWTPVYYPMLLSAAFAYWIWPTKAYTSLARRIAGASFAIVRAAYFAMFISFFCAISGEFYSSIPHLMKMEILWGPVGVFLGTLQGTVIFGLFFAHVFIMFGVFVGSLIVLGAHLVQHSFGSGSDQRSNLSAILRSAKNRPGSAGSHESSP
jgi:hypothetical protein